MQSAFDRSRCSPAGPAWWWSFHVPGRPCCLQVSGQKPFLLLSSPHCQEFIESVRRRDAQGAGLC